MTLEPYQEEAVAWLSRRTRGAVIAPAGSGKTIIAAASLDRVVSAVPREKKIRVGWMANTIEQCLQAMKALQNFPAVIEHCRIKIECAAANTDWSPCDVLIVDECHHAASAPGWRAQIENFRGPVWGFTATPPERDDKPLEFELFLELFGDIFTVERQDVGRLAHAKVVLLNFSDKDASYRIDSNIERNLPIRRRQLFYSGIPEGQIYGMVAWNAVIEEGIVRNNARTMAAILVAKRHVLKNDSVLVLANQIEHCQQIAELIPNARACWAGMGRPKRARALESFSEGRLRCLVATSLADEGLDIPRANVLVLVSGGKSRAKTEQRTGRVLREFYGKEHGVIYDFEDTHHPLMAKHSRKRQEKYLELGYEITN